MYSFFGVCFGLLAIPYLAAMVFEFKWWIAPVFFVVGGLLVGVVYERMIASAAGLTVFATPIGIALAAAALLM